jgi:hypothetical protein
MSHFLKYTAVATYLLIGVTVSGCSTLASAYDSVANTVSGVFQSDEAKK